MQLNDILEEHSLKGISQRTNISEENLQSLLNTNFDTLNKIKTLGFISIIEREYQADLTVLRKEALDYYDQQGENNGFSVRASIVDEKKKKSKLFIFIILAILGYASWYFLTQFDKKHLSQLIPFMDNQLLENISSSKVEKNKEEDVAVDLSIENIVLDGNESDVVIETTLENVDAIK